MLVGKSWQQTEIQVCIYIYICCGDRMYLLRINHGYISADGPEWVVILFGGWATF